MNTDPLVEVRRIDLKICQSNNYDLVFNRIYKAIIVNLEDQNFTVGSLSKAAFLSRSQLYRNVKKNIGVSPQFLITWLRIKKGAQFLESGVDNITWISYSVGFKSSSHFSRRFRYQYGIPPSKYKCLHSTLKCII
ncbi:helix-turn-helix transcriptional regulator [Microbulbifer sp. A4B17]|uniref:helix-turn-helix transcriptional regulator n=1 Tax=Microbulbifer sp. A4B17 TaxID=359370 RepID=UPI0013003C64|nr:AraC family transcriptional regulator [Microbulbifer sp. A4B17]